MVSESWRESFKQTATTFISDFVAENPEYSLSSEKLEQGWTNHVALGSYQGEAVVFKYYSMPERWKNELFCLKHFAPTGFVPDVHTIVDDQLIVMSFVPGTMPRRDGIDQEVLSSPEKLVDLSHHLGQATGALVATPLPTDSEGTFPPPGFVPYSPVGWTSDLKESIAFFVDLGRRIYREVRAFSDPVFAEYLDLLEEESKTIDDERKILFHSDFGNLHVMDGRVQGFFDLESCRLGTESMQLSKALLACEHYGLIRESFLTGYEEVTGSRSCADNPFRILAMEQLEFLILRICADGRWRGSDEDKNGSERFGSEAIPRLKKEISRHRHVINFRQWFPSLV